MLSSKHQDYITCFMASPAVYVIATIIFVVAFAALLVKVYRGAESCGAAVAAEMKATAHYAVVPDAAMRSATVERFLWEMAHEKPIRFSPRQLAGFTRGYSARLGAGGFGTVYGGALPNGLAVAVKVLRGGMDRRRSEEQFMAEVGTIGRTHHINLVRLFGFCFDAAVRALVYEYMGNGALDAYLFDRSRDVGVPARRAIAVGVARGLRYLHEECEHKIVHYDIKPGNVLLDGGMTPKVADFGLARLVNRGDTHVSVSGMRGTPGYAAPETWMQSGVTEKCDVYSFGMLLLEIAGRRRNFDEAAPESQQWWPMAAWTRYERGELMMADDDAAVVNHPSGEICSGGDGEAVVTVAEADDERRCKEAVERMYQVAFWCVQQRPEARPPMGAVVKMLEGEMDVAPPVNPFLHLMAAPAPVTNPWATTTTTTASSGNAVSENVVVSHGSDGIVSL
ncbi:G-type lectin S-receptor-like serine/threonine-protein kinase At1g34300 [Oryza glaberrima]|nr:G-type lectin S-receptor-like serine/threonine-protein kinase At1g34300 [Oryza glaberrima]